MANGLSSNETVRKKKEAKRRRSALYDFSRYAGKCLSVDVSDRGQVIGYRLKSVGTLRIVR